MPYPVVINNMKKVMNIDNNNKPNNKLIISVYQIIIE